LISAIFARGLTIIASSPPSYAQEMEAWVPLNGSTASIAISIIVEVSMHALYHVHLITVFLISTGIRTVFLRRWFHVVLNARVRYLLTTEPEN
jgi:hypothetical protein